MMERFTAAPGTGIAMAILFAFVLVSTIYLLNRAIRKRMKSTGDDVRLEAKLDGGDTIHAEGVLGGGHPEEGGMPVEPLRRKQEKQDVRQEERKENSRPMV